MRTLAAVSLLVLAIAACAPTEPGSQDRSATAGQYALRTVNDTAPPYVVLRGTTFAVQILSDTLNLGADGAYRGIAHYKRTNTDLTTQAIVDTVQGTWIILGSSVSLKSSGGDLSTALSSVSSTRLTVTGGGLVTVYTK